MFDFSEFSRVAEQLEQQRDKGDVAAVAPLMESLQASISSLNDRLQDEQVGSDESGQVTAHVTAAGALVSLEVSPRLIQTGGEPLSDAIMEAVMNAHRAAGDAVGAPPAAAGQSSASDPEEVRRSLLAKVEASVPADFGFLRDLMMDAVSTGIDAAQAEYSGQSSAGEVEVVVGGAGQLIRVVVDRVATRDMDNVTFAECVVEAVARAGEQRQQAMVPKLSREFMDVVEDEIRPEMDQTFGRGWDPVTGQTPSGA